MLRQEGIVIIVQNFYSRVFSDEPWFTGAFERVGGIEHHVRTPSAMLIDAMGGGLAYHGGALTARGIDVSEYDDKQELVNHALRL